MNLTLNMKPHYLLVLLFFSICHSTIFAQQFRLTPYERSYGLPTEVIKDIEDDEQGFLWVATDEGVIRFDGQNVISFREQTKSNYIKKIIQTADKQLFVLHDEGLSEIIIQQDSTFIQTLIKGNPTPTDSTLVFPKEIYQDTKNRVWISENVSVIHFSPQKNTFKRYNFDEKYRSHDFLIGFTFFEDEDANLWAISIYGDLFRYNESSDKFDLITSNQRFSKISDILEIRQNVYWIATDEGVFEAEITSKTTQISWKLITDSQAFSCLYRTKTDRIFAGTWNTGLWQVSLKNEKVELKLVGKIENNTIYDISEDGNDNLWICSGKGLLLLQTPLFGTPDLIAGENHVSSFIQTPDNEMYVNQNGTMFHLVQKKASQIPVGKLSKLLPPNLEGNMMFMASDKNGVWFATQTGKIYRRDLHDNSLKTFEVINEVDAQNRGVLFFIQIDSQGNAWILHDKPSENLFCITTDFEIINYGKKQGLKDKAVTVREGRNGKIYVGANSPENYLYEVDNQSNKLISIALDFPFPLHEIFSINDISQDQKGQLWLASTMGLFQCDLSNKKAQRIDLGDFTKEGIRGVIAERQGNGIWFGGNFGLGHYENELLRLFDESEGLPAKTIAYRSLFLDKNDNFWAGTSNGAIYLQDDSRNQKSTRKPVFLSLKINGKRVLKDSKAIFEENSYLEAEYIALSHPTENLIYQYQLIGSEDTTWSSPTSNQELIIPQLKAGDYTLKIRAKQEGGYLWSVPLKYDFEVKVPWYRSWAILPFILIFMAFLVWSAIKIYTWRLKHQNRVLEALVEARTSEILEKSTQLEQQKEEILVSNEKLQEQNEKLDKQQVILTKSYHKLEKSKKQLDAKNQQITDSIRYAETIQRAILPINALLKDNFDDFFVIFMPKDIVSGDFYWFGKHENTLFVSVADCMGHGVPGAFMSMIGYSTLNQIINEQKIHQTNLILTELNKKIKVALRQNTTDNQDGMDIGIIRLEPQSDNTCNLAFSGAKQNLFYIQNNDIQVVKGNRFSVGGMNKRQVNEVNFTENNLTLPKQTMIYLSSDGFIDQNDTNRKRLGSTKFMNLLYQNHAFSCQKQHENLTNALKNHQKNTEQRDDITVMGIKI